MDKNNSKLGRVAPDPRARLGLELRRAGMLLALAVSSLALAVQSVTTLRPLRLPSNLPVSLLLLLLLLD